MEHLLKTLFLFIIFSIIGWLLETVYRSYMDKKFANPGFMNGITLPIYGFGGLFLFGLCNLIDQVDLYYRLFLLFFLSAAIATAIEYIAGSILLKYFNTKLWDYSSFKYNYKGLICPYFTFIWANLSVLFYLGLYPYLPNILNAFINNIYYVFFFGIFFGIFLIDLFISLDLLNVIKKYNNHIKETVSYERLKFKMQKNKEHSSYFSNFKLKDYIKEKRTQLNKKK